MIGRLVLVVCSLVAMGGLAFAHEGHPHGKAADEAQMARLHEMMPKYAHSQEVIETALEKGDAATVEKETGYLLSTIPDLKKSKPHHRLKRIKDFKTIAASFEKDVKATAALAKKGDIKGAKAAFDSAQKRCSACHAEFRD